MDYQFKNLVNLQKIKDLISLFYQATGIIITIVDPQGIILATTPWRNICSNFHRAYTQSKILCTKSDVNLSKKMFEKEKKFIIYKCGNGLIDAAAPIIIQGKHVATIYTGQVFFEKPNIQYFRKQAKKFDLPESEYLDALREVPIMKEENLKHVMMYLSSFAELLGEMGLKELKQMESQKEILVAKEELEVSQKILIAAFEELRNQYDKK